MINFTREEERRGVIINRIMVIVGSRRNSLNRKEMVALLREFGVQVKDNCDQHRANIN